MEKFTKWADKGTGVNPFLPLRPPTTKGLVGKLAGVVGGLVLFGLRLPLLILTGGWLVALSLVAMPVVDVLVGLAVLGYVHTQGGGSKANDSLQQVGLGLLGLGVGMAVLAPLHRFVNILIVRPALNLLVKVLGVTFVEQHANLRKLGLRPPGHKPPTGRVGADIQSGDLLVSNHTSALEVLYFASRFLPVFASFSLAPEVRFGTMSILGAVRRASGVPSKAGGSQGSSSSSTLEGVLTQAKKQRVPVVLFPEMVRTNGEGILAFPKGVLDTPSLGGNAGVHVFGFSAPKGELLAAHTVGNGLWFLLKLVCTWRTIVHVTYVGAQDVPLHPSASSASTSSSTVRRTGTVSPAQWSEEVRTLLATMLARPKLNTLGVDDFLTFGQYWHAVWKGDDKTAATLASAREKL